MHDCCSKHSGYQSLRSLSLLLSNVPTWYRTRYAVRYESLFSFSHNLSSNLNDAVRLGTSGLKISSIILGCMTYGTPEWQGWVLGEEEGLQHIKVAFDAGINTFDTANVCRLYSQLSVPSLNEMFNRCTRTVARRRYSARRSNYTTCQGMNSSS
jgi:hypothetical protein